MDRLLLTVILLMIGSALANAAGPFRLDRRVPCDTSRLLGTPDPPPPYRTRRTFERLKLTQPVFVVAEPNSDRLLVVEHNSRVVAFKDDPAVDKLDTFLEVPKYETYAIALHPNYVKNGQVFVFAHGPREQKPPVYNRIYRFEAKGKPRVCDPKSQRLVIEWASNGHSGGDLLFGPDGFLYITSGDGTPGSDADETGQDLRDLCSGILRLDVDRPDPGKGYSVPKDNPFLHIKDARPEMYAFGLRNPWRMSLDPVSKSIWIGDVGQDVWEMIYVLRRGGNYGWSVYEGSHPFYLKRKLGPAPVILPAVEHHHAESRSISGGVFYYGSRLPELKGTYFYGDYATGRIWGLRHENTRVTWHGSLASTRLQIVGFGLDHAGDLLIVDYGGALHRLEPTPLQTARADWPRKLSATGLFLSTANHVPHPGLIPYSVNSPLWSDGAAKERYVALPGTKSMTFTENGSWRFPEGTVLVKTFALEREAGKPASRRRVETRLLTFQQGEWQGYSYRWDDAQADAELVAAGGRDCELTVAEQTAPGGQRKQIWHFPSRTECMVCHVRSGFVLGLNTLQMNRVHDYGQERENQLLALTRLGALRFEEADPRPGLENKAEDLLAIVTTLLRPVPAKLHDRWTLALRNATKARWQAYREALRTQLLPSGPPGSGFPRYPDSYRRLAEPYVPTGDLTARARSYLHANCAHCHVNEGGGNSAIDLHVNTLPEKMRLFDVKPLHDSFGLPDARLVAAGMPERSVLLHRISTHQRGRMPPLASSVVDKDAVELLHAWIKGLKPAAAVGK